MEAGLEGLRERKKEGMMKVRNFRVKALLYLVGINPMIILSRYCFGDWRRRQSCKGWYELHMKLELPFAGKKFSIATHSNSFLNKTAVQGGEIPSDLRSEDGSGWQSGYSSEVGTCFR